MVRDAGARQHNRCSADEISQLLLTRLFDQHNAKLGGNLAVGVAWTVFNHNRLMTVRHQRPGRSLVGNTKPNNQGRRKIRSRRRCGLCLHQPLTAFT